MPSPLDLITTATAASFLGCDASDARLPLLITAASESIRDFVGYEVQRRTGVVETVVGQGGPHLFLRAGAVTAVASITVDGEEVPVEEYALDGAAPDGAHTMGRIVRRCGAWPFTGDDSEGVHPTPQRARDTGAIVVTFDAGWVTPGQAALDGALTINLPATFQLAALETVTSAFSGVGQDANVASISMGPSSISFGPDGRLPLPKPAQVRLKPKVKPTRRTFG